MDKIRLDRFLSSQLNLSRSDAKKLLKSKCVTVNGIPALKAEQGIDAETDEVAVYNKIIKYKEHIYIMLNKPQGVVSASRSEEDTTVVDILPEELRRQGLFPAGRLDKDTTGFVLITDDGEFAHDILSPARHVPKTYLVTAERPLSPDEMRRFAEGMLIGDEQFKPASLRFLHEGADGLPVYEIILTEGRYHQIKRMFASAGSAVIRLHRTGMGGLMLDEKLSPGQCRELSSEEKKRIRGD